MAPSIPTWVAPTARQVADCDILAAAVREPYELGVVAALRWVLGAAPSPITRREEAASPAAAEEEFFVAGLVELGDSPLSATIPAAGAQGVVRTLSWLLGWEANPPIRLPRRPVPTADQLYGEAAAAEPWRYRLPEEKAAGRVAAQREAARLARLAARADGTAGQ